MAFLLFANLVLFVYTAARILAVRKDTAILHKADSARTQSATETQRSVTSLLLSAISSRTHCDVCHDFSLRMVLLRRPRRAHLASEDSGSEEEGDGARGEAGCLPCRDTECRWVRVQLALHVVIAAHRTAPSPARRAALAAPRPPWYECHVPSVPGWCCTSSSSA